MNYPETEPKSIIVKSIAPSGLGFGEGGITVKKQIETGIITPDTPAHVAEVLTEDPDSFKPVETDDDGCGDGRPWVKILHMVQNGDMREVISYKRSLLRAKVFGGGLVVASSMWRTMMGTPRTGATAGNDRAIMAQKLEVAGIKHGAHTSDHAQGDNCGCGAIDNYQQISANAVKYRSQITDALRAVIGDDYTASEPAIQQAFDAYETLVEETEYFSDASGKQSMEQIIDSGAVVKELYGEHIEETIIINDVPGTTLDQQYFTQRVKELSAEKPRIIQAFVVDTWRGRQLADTVAEIVSSEDSSVDTEYMRKLAYADFLIRTLAVAGTLTAGDLPVYQRSYSAESTIENVA